MTAAATATSVVLEPADAEARDAGLRYVNSNGPGIRRRRRGKGFSYVGVDGRRLEDPRTFARIKSLAIPPAWTDVWISPIANGHLQATGRDSRGRKQYRYHDRWRKVRDESKYERTLSFARALPRLRRRVKRDLARPGLPQEKVLAAVVSLLEKTLIRVGNGQYARENNSFGLTTLKDRHARIVGERLEFTFVGKSGKKQRVDIRDARLARIVKRCRDIPGYDLFQYIDDNGDRRVISSGDVNDYLRATMDEGFTAKDFRTWTGTVLATHALASLGSFGSETEAKRNITQCIEEVAGQLGNTQAICRKCYVHPAILDAYLAGDLEAPLPYERISGLSAREAAVVGFLEGRPESAQSA
jgi:DNA topoisomerase-1